MFKRNKKKEEKETVVSKVGDTTTTTTTYQSSSQRRLSENVTERTVIYNSSSYSSTRVTKSDFGKLSISGQTPGAASLFDARRSFLKPLSPTVPAVDARPFNTSNLPSNGTGYQSSFSRKLTPYNVDANPFSPKQPTLSTPTSIGIQPPSSSQNLLRYSSYLPERTNELSSSTYSLPVSNHSYVQDPRIPTYNTQGKKRGKVVIINNIKFMKVDQERKGAELDEKDLKSLFKSLGFEVEIHRDLKKSAMMDKIKKFSSDSSLKSVDISVLIMMSHGSNVDDDGIAVQGGFTQIYGTDDKGLPIEEILDRFSVENCRAMSGKAKIFIFQCCRGQAEERTLHKDVAPITKNVVKNYADMLIAFSTLPGFFSIRDTHQGSWYIQCICEVFKKHAKEFDVETLLKIVDDNLSQKHPKYQQTSSYESRGFKRCYLNPK